MSPELLHVDAGAAAGELERAESAFVGHLTVDIHDRMIVVSVTDKSAGALAALLRRQAHVVALQQADVQVQQRRTLDHRVAHIAALTTLCGAAVEILPAVVRQIEIPYRHRQSHQQRSVLTHQGHAVGGDGHIHRHLPRRRFVIAVLPGVTLSTRLHGDMQRDLRPLLSAAGGHHRGILPRRARREEVRAPGNVRCSLVPVVLDHGIRQRVSLPVGKDLLQWYFEHTALRDGIAFFRRRDVPARCDRLRPQHQQRRCQTQESAQLRSDMVIFHAASSSALMVVYSA